MKNAGSFLKRPMGFFNILQQQQQFTLQTQTGRGHISYRITGKSQTKRKNRKNTIVKVGKA